MYTGRAPVDYREMNALYARYCCGEIDLPEDIITECLRIQKNVITGGSLGENAANDLGQGLMIESEQNQQDKSAGREERLKHIRRMGLQPPETDDEEVIIYSIPGITERGFILTRDNINELTRDTLVSKVREFAFDFDLDTPNIDEMSGDDLREWLIDVCNRSDVRLSWKEGQDSREFSRLMSGLVYEHPKNGKKILEHSRIADYLREKYRTISFKDQIYIFDKEEGIYRKNTGELEEEFRRIVEFHDIKCKVRSECGDVLFFVKNSNQVKEEFPFNKCENLIPVKNGVIHIDPVVGTANLIPYSSDHKFLFKIPRNYYPDIDTSPMMEILRSWVPESDIPFIIQSVAQALVQMMTGGQLKKATLLQGQKNGAKSTCINFIESFLGNLLSERASLQ